MKLFYQLSRDGQDAAIEHCADLIANNALDNGLQIEVTDDEDGQELKKRIDTMLEEMSERKDLTTRAQKIKFLMEDQSFADTIFELASEMAHNAFYHSDDELVITLDALNERIEDNEQVDDEPEEKNAPRTVEELVNHSKRQINKNNMN